MKSLNLVLCTLTVFSLSSFGQEKPTQLERALQKTNERQRHNEIEEENRKRAVELKKTVRLATGVENAQSAVCTDSKQRIIINFGNPEVIETVDAGTEAGMKILSPREDIVVHVETFQTGKQQTLTFKKDDLQASVTNGAFTFSMPKVFGDVNGLLGTRDFRTGRFVQFKGRTEAKDSDKFSCEFFQSELTANRKIAVRAVKPVVEAPKAEVKKPVEAPKEAPKPAVEAPKEAPKPVVEAPKEAPMPKVEAPKEAPMPKVEAPKVAPMPVVEAPKEAPKPMVDAPKDVELDKEMDKVISGETAVKPTPEQIAVFNSMVQSTTQQGTQWYNSMRSWLNSRIGN